MEIIYTEMGKEFEGTRIDDMIKESLKHFPELKNKRVIIGKTNYYAGIAYSDNCMICLNPKKRVSYNTIGHELTHLLQRMNGIPTGEVTCDIWTLARGEPFLDTPPHYLRLSENIRKNWKDWDVIVSELCKEAIKKRETKRQYIVWLYKELEKLEGEVKEHKNTHTKTTQINIDEVMAMASHDSAMDGSQQKSNKNRR